MRANRRFSTRHRYSMLMLLSLAFVATAPSEADARRPDEETSMNVISKDGTRIAYDRQGSGPALILVAGALSGREGGAELAKLLSPRFTVISYDRRGRGDSTDTKPYSVKREIEDLEALIDSAGGSAFVYGKS